MIDTGTKAGDNKDSDSVTSKVRILPAQLKLSGQAESFFLSGIEAIRRSS